MDSNGRIQVGLLGLGYWGPNLARNFARLPGTHLKWLCDLSADLRDQHAPNFPDATFTDNYDDLLNDPELDAIILASPVPTHFALGRKALLAGKHTFIEKPLALNYADAKELADLAEEQGVQLMVGHLLEYHPGVLYVKEMIDSGELGDVLYAYSHRLNLGQFRRDENALWSLGVHDVATLMFLIGEAPVEVTARGESYLHDGVEDVVFGSMKFGNGVLAHMHLSWLDPHKMRKLTVVGTKKMVVFDDMEVDRKVTVYDKGFQLRDAEGNAVERSSAPSLGAEHGSTSDATRRAGSGSWGEYISKREGEIYIPRIAGDEPLRLEAQHFIDSIVTGSTPRSDGRDGERVVHVLELLQQSMDASGAPLALSGAQA